MTTTQQAPTAIAQKLTAGVVGGIAGGLVFGMAMQMMSMMPMVAMLVGSHSVAVGWLVHLAISAALGVGYALTVGPRGGSVGSALGVGMVYGVVWWVLGALVLMPAKLGMATFQFNTTTMRSLAGHLMYGVVLALVWRAVAARGRH